MSPEIIATIAALSGTLVGGLINFVTTRSLKTKEWQLTIIRERLNDRQKLYADFLIITQRLLMQSTESKIEKLTELDVMNNEFARIELLGTEKVVDAARLICGSIVNAHAQAPKEEEKSFYLIKQEFISAVKIELIKIEKT